MPAQILLWVGFNLFVLAMLAIDLGLFHRRAHEVNVRESLIWTGVWIALALLFNAGLYWWRGPDSALEYLTGYLLEKSLSVDNIFVFLVIFSYFKVPGYLQHRVLFWGVLGALVMRAFFIATGVTLIHTFEWIVYVFGAFLIFTGARMAMPQATEYEPEHNPVLRLVRRLVPVTGSYEGTSFFVKKRGRWMATPLFVVLAVIESTDVLFALDSIPAILAITYDPFIVYTSNVFAILGLRALYFALAGIMQYFHYLHYGLAAILVFVGIKMLVTDVYPIPVTLALGVVAALLTASVVASLVWAKAPPVDIEAFDPDRADDDP